ncbi:MAG: hypothetical protein IM568_14405 [Flavobacterium sp.]|jgi:hypothetical protein|nr:hypothetical protein [Flavobacterium sp.]
MPVKKRKTTKKRKSIGSTIGSYVKKLMRTPSVKRAGDSVKVLERKLAAAKKKKAAAVKKARKSLKK